MPGIWEVFTDDPGEDPCSSPDAFHERERQALLSILLSRLLSSGLSLAQVATLEYREDSREPRGEFKAIGHDVVVFALQNPGRASPGN